MSILLSQISSILPVFIIFLIKNSNMDSSYQKISETKYNYFSPAAFHLNRIKRQFPFGGGRGIENYISSITGNAFNSGSRKGCNFCPPRPDTSSYLNSFGLPDANAITSDVDRQIQQSWQYAGRLAQQQAELAKNISQQNTISSPQEPVYIQPPEASNQNNHQFLTSVKPHNQNPNIICGYSSTGSASSSSYIYGGEPIKRGEWPWLVAFYRSGNGANLVFICGGTLISNLHVLTAAHCVQDKGQDAPLPPQDGLLFLGKHNLIQWNEIGYESRGSKNIKIHPEWKPFERAYDSDLALIEMETSVTYSRFIRPICLWNGPKNIDLVVGQVGIVAGWGRNQFDRLNTEFPKKVSVPIISEGQCLRSHVGFTYLTSSRTFCAGSGKGETPCKGDSGGGLMLKSGDRWFIRGVVSSGLVEGNRCYIDKSTVFTDVAKHLDWIYQNSYPR